MYVTAAVVPRTKGKDVLIYAVALFTENLVSLTGTTEYVYKLMLNDCLDICSCVAEILSGVEVVGMLHKVLTDTCGASHSEVGVDVNLTYCHACSLTQHILGYADSVLKLAAVFVDYLYEFLRNGRCTVQYDREFGKSLAYFFEDIETELRLRTGLEFVCAVGSTDSDSEGVNARLAYELFYFFGTGIGAVLSGNLNVVFDASETAEFAFYGNAVVVSVLNNFFGEFDIVFERVVATVNHYGVETAVDTALAEFESIAVVEVQANRKMADFFCSFYHFSEIYGVSVLSCAGRNLQNKRSVFFGSGFYDTLNDFHIVYVKSTDSVFAGVCFFEHFFRCYEWHNITSKIILSHRF